MYCGHCAPCTVGIDVALVNKYLNLALAQGEMPETVADHYKLLEHHASECIACGSCERNCPFSVGVVEKMKKAAPFASGRAGKCGAVMAAEYVLEQVYGQNAGAKISEFEEKFIEKGKGSVMCRDLMGRCRNCVTEAALLLEEML